MDLEKNQRIHNRKENLGDWNYCFDPRWRIFYSEK